MHAEPEPDTKLQELVVRVAAWVAAHPGDSAVLLQAVTAGLKHYERAVQDRRDTVAWGALNTLACLAKLPKPLQVLGTLAGPAFYLFPNGPEGHAPGAVRFWGEFLDAARKEMDPDLRDWLRMTRGADFVTWWERVVAPALAADPGETS